LLCLTVAIYSGNELWKIRSDYRAEAEMHSAVMVYKPEPEQIINQSVIDLQAKYPDVVGWLTVPGTKIDYPFVQYDDNDFYLRRDLNGNHATAGTLFMDFRNALDFSSGNTIIYGHHMKNGSMFGTLKSFADSDFFEANRHGTIFLPHETLTLEFFDYRVVESTDPEIYSVERDEFDGRIVTLSTCAYDFDGARIVLLAKII